MVVQEFSEAKKSKKQTKLSRRRKETVKEGRSIHNR